MSILVSAILFRNGLLAASPEDKSWIRGVCHNYKLKALQMVKQNWALTVKSSYRLPAILALCLLMQLKLAV